MFFVFVFQNYDTSESKLRREFEVYGTIKKIIVIQNAETGKPRGYAFIEYEHERDMHCEYKQFSVKLKQNICRSKFLYEYDEKQTNETVGSGQRVSYRSPNHLN